MWWIPAIPHAFQTSQMRLLNTSSLHIWHIQKELRNFMSPLDCPSTRYSKASFNLSLSIFSSWPRKVGERHLFCFIMVVILLHFAKCTKKWGSFQNKVKWSKKGQRRFAFNQCLNFQGRGKVCLFRAERKTSFTFWELLEGESAPNQPLLDFLKSRSPWGS